MAMAAVMVKVLFEAGRFPTRKPKVDGRLTSRAAAVKTWAADWKAQA